jgi:hypothetical protein
MGFWIILSMYDVQAAYDVELFYLLICGAFYLYVRCACRSICMTCGPHYMYDVQAAVHVRIRDYFIYSSAEQANKLTGICNYFIYFTLSIWTCGPHYTVYDVQAALPFRIRDYFIFICRAGK